MPEAEHDDFPAVRELTRQQRRVLGTLLEKGFTTPDQYPLTVKACTSGCNQKSNRDPVTGYSEDQVLDVLEELQQLGLAAVVHTESGRTERYRHYMRKRFTLSEPQLAILTELMLRGRQSLGELRGRASRMIPIESLEDLRRELDGLLAAGLISTDGSLDRRGAEVDHGLYTESERRRLPPPRTSSESHDDTPRVPPSSSGVTASAGQSSDDLLDALDSMRSDQRGTRADLERLQEEVRELRQIVDTLRRDLGQ